MSDVYVMYIELQLSRLQVDRPQTATQGPPRTPLHLQELRWSRCPGPLVIPESLLTMIH